MSSLGLLQDWGRLRAAMNGFGLSHWGISGTSEMRRMLALVQTHLSRSEAKALGRSWDGVGQGAGQGAVPGATALASLGSMHTKPGLVGRGGESRDPVQTQAHSSLKGAPCEPCSLSETQFPGHEVGAHLLLGSVVMSLAAGGATSPGCGCCAGWLHPLVGAPVGR